MVVVLSVRKVLEGIRKAKSPQRSHGSDLQKYIPYRLVHTIKASCSSLVANNWIELIPRLSTWLIILELTFPLLGAGSQR